MVSDTLSDASHEIAEYQATLPTVYRQVGRDLNGLRSIMDSVRQWLDNPQPKGKCLDADFIRMVADAMDNEALPIPVWKR